MNWVQRNNVTPEESRRLFAENRWVILGSMFLFFVVILGIPVPLIIADVPTEPIFIGGLLLMVAFGIGSRIWGTRKIEAMRAETPPDIGGPRAGE